MTIRIRTASNNLLLSSAACAIDKGFLDRIYALGVPQCVCTLDSL